MACKLQKLFSVEAEFEDEDFLMAVSDVETQALDTTSANLRGLRPLSAGLRGPGNALTPVKDPGTRSFSETMPPISQVQNCSRLQFGEGICTTEAKSNHMLPLISSFKVQKDPAGVLAKCESGSASGKRFKFVNRPPAIFPSGAAPSDELDNELVLAACMDLEESSMYPESFRSDCGSQKQMRDNDVETAKKRQVTNSMIPVNPIGLDTSQMKKTRKEAVDEVVSHLQPMGVSSESTLRPTSMDSGFSQSNLGMSNSIGSFSNSSIQMIKSVQASLDKSIAERSSPCLPLIRPCSPFISTSTPSRLPKSRVFSPSCSDSRMASNGGQLHITYGPSVATVGTPPVIPKAPCSVTGAGKPQTPVVTNHLVRLVTAASKTPQPMAHVSLRTKTRRFPGPAGILPQQVREHSGDTPNGKNLDEILIATPQMPTHGAVAKLRTEEMPISQQTIEEEFERGPWVAMKNELDLDEGDPSCFLQMYSISMVLRKAALKQLPKNKVPNMAVMVKSLMRTNVDAGAEFKDPTGEMQGTIHRLLLEEKESEFKTGSVLLLKQVSVFSPSHRNHYLNVTPSNLVKVYSPGFKSGNWPQLYQEIRETRETVTPQQDPPTSAVVVMAATDYRNVEGCERNKNKCHRVSASNKSPSLLQESGSCGAGKSAERADLDDLDQLLGELPDDFFSSLEEQSTL